MPMGGLMPYPPPGGGGQVGIQPVGQPMPFQGGGGGGPFGGDGGQLQSIIQNMMQRFGMPGAPPPGMNAAPPPRPGDFNQAPVPPRPPVSGPAAGMAPMSPPPSVAPPPRPGGFAGTPAPGMDSPPMPQNIDWQALLPLLMQLGLGGGGGGPFGGGGGPITL